MAKEVENAEKSGMSRGIRILLIASLALNLLVVGVVVGGAFRGKSPRPFGGAEMTLGAFTQAMSPEHRRALGARLRDAQGAQRPGQGARAEAIRSFLSALKADPFDPTAIEALFAEQQQRASAGMAAGQQALLEQLESMSPSERAEFADRIENRLRRVDRR